MEMAIGVCPHDDIRCIEQEAKRCTSHEYREGKGMYTAQQVSGPVLPGQYGATQMSDHMSYYPMQTTDWT